MPSVECPSLSHALNSNALQFDLTLNDLAHVIQIEISTQLKPQNLIDLTPFLYAHTDVTEDPCDLVSMLSMSEHIEKVLDQLDSEALTVLKFRFGLRGQDHLTLDQTAERLNLTRGKVRGIQLRALKDLKVLCDQEGLSLNQVQDEDQDEA